jgi:hypothetical protein
MRLDVSMDEEITGRPNSTGEADSDGEMSHSTTAPVALFLFNRPELTAQVYGRIRAARPQRLLVVADGPRAGCPGEGRRCEEAREIVTSPDWPCEVQVNFASQNLGCRRRVSSGLDWVFQQCSEAIILEDDCVPCASFFDFCSAMLRRYRDDNRIVHISGGNFQDGRRRGSASYYISRYPYTWGWASWRRAWQAYDVNISAWPAAYRERWLESIFDDPQEAQYWEAIFDRLYRGQIDTWDYQWMFACWRQGGLSIVPNENLVTNVGVGPDATHFQAGHSTIGIATRELDELEQPAVLAPDRQADRYTFERHIIGQATVDDGNWFLAMKRRLRLRSRLKQLVPRALRYRWPLTS